MTPEDLDRVANSFTSFHDHFAPFFGRAEAQRRSEQYLRGLLVQHADRRNAENISECITGASPRALQRFLTEAPWHHRPIIAALQQHLAPLLSHSEAVYIFDETAAAKQGKRSLAWRANTPARLAKSATVRLASSSPTLPQLVMLCWMVNSICRSSGLMMLIVVVPPVYRRRQRCRPKVIWR